MQRRKNCKPAADFLYRIIGFIMLFFPALASSSDMIPETDAGLLKQYAAETALKAYHEQSPQARIIKKFNGSLHTVNRNRIKAAQLAIQSGKCDYVTSSDIVADYELEYEVICKNGAIIYLKPGSLKQAKSALDRVVVPEKEKALSREVAMSRCLKQVESYAAKKEIQARKLHIDRYQMNSLINAIGETIVNINFSLSETKYAARCVFRYNQKDSFEVKDI